MSKPIRRSKLASWMSRDLLPGTEMVVTRSVGQRPTCALRPFVLLVKGLDVVL